MMALPQLGALGLLVNAIVLYNTIYAQRALDHLAACGLLIDDADVERLSPLRVGSAGGAHAARL